MNLTTQFEVTAVDFIFKAVPSGMAVIAGESTQFGICGPDNIEYRHVGRQPFIGYDPNISVTSTIKCVAHGHTLYVHAASLLAYRSARVGMRAIPFSADNGQTITEHVLVWLQNVSRSDNNMPKVAE